MIATRDCVKKRTLQILDVLSQHIHFLLRYSDRQANRAKYKVSKYWKKPYHAQP